MLIVLVPSTVTLTLTLDARTLWLAAAQRPAVEPIAALDDVEEAGDLAPSFVGGDHHRSHRVQAESLGDLTDLKSHSLP
ncbi:hypothetical protein BH23ACT2_BH23ACT2_22410 [soil metagenome]